MTSNPTLFDLAPATPVGPPPARFIGRCPVKGCRQARLLEIPRRAVERTDRRWGYTYTAHELEWRIGGHAPGDSRNFVYGDSVWRFIDRGSCPDHGRPFGRFREVDGTHNPAVKCDARCQNARRADCECSCAGANHGAAWGA